MECGSVVILGTEGGNNEPDLSRSYLPAEMSTGFYQGHMLPVPVLAWFSNQHEVLEFLAVL